jgi:DNA polymerase IV
MDYISSESVGFNGAPPTIMHIDLNSCFASIEQQANPLIRGKPVAVAAYTTPGGCVLAVSKEAKQFHIATGMRVGEARSLCGSLIVLPADPNKYRYINRKLLAIFRCYTSEVEIKSIDEMILVLTNAPALSGYKRKGIPTRIAMTEIGKQIKIRIQKEIGEWLTVSIGIAPNRYLAKIAAGFHKPDGLDIIDITNIDASLEKMALEELKGIKTGYGSQLRRYGITSATEFYNAPISLLTGAFHSIIGYHWWLRLHGWEGDDREFDRKSFGQSYALYTSYPPQDERVHQILCQLTEKMARRMRQMNYKAGGIHVACLFDDYSFWHKGKKLQEALYSTNDLYKAALRILNEAPNKPVRTFFISCHYLSDLNTEQQELFGDTQKKHDLVTSLDKIQDRWGEFTVIPARMLNMEHKILDRIAFGGVKNLEEQMFRDSIEHDPVME